MAEVKKNNNKKATKTSKVQSVSRKKIQVSELSSDDLMEQILNKKKNSKKVTTKEKSVTNKVKSNKINNKKELFEKSSEDIYEMIKAKKNAKSSAIKKASTSKSKGAVKKKVALDKAEVKNASKKDLSSDELYDLIKSKKSKAKSTVKKEVEEKKVDKKVSKEDLIITREITFTEDKLDLKDKKLLKDLKEAIQEFDALDDTAPVPVIEEKVEKKIDNVILTKIVAVIVLILFVFLLFCLFSNVFVDKPEVVNKEKNNNVIEVVDERPILYEECLLRPLDENDKTEEVLTAESELTNYLNDNYDVSLIYEDLSLGFSFSYNTEEVYYAASTIKSLGALYIYTKAAEGELSLDETIKYTSKFVWGSSRKMKNHKLGDEISLRTLVEYSITVSDNSAHQMLVSYIGKSTLKEFGKSLGAEYTMYGSDNFGHITVTDAIIYMKAINDFINNNGELGQELKSYFVSADQNGLKMDDLGIEAAHKYGEYAPYYHDIGIVYDDNPYVIAILTTEKSGDYQGKIQDINRRVYELHKLYYTNRENVCYNQVYGS